MNNEKIRKALRVNNIKHYELAEMLEISETTLCRMFRKELPEDKQKEIVQMIERKGEQK